ncbi:hypothetical protein HDV06_001370 [Boothiomyces sp. JEL0866]|nr:hypothetical protein HDV06_001370 [Boothiomyces sp. JEL0866]
MQQYPGTQNQQQYPGRQSQQQYVAQYQQQQYVPQNQQVPLQAPPVYQQYAQPYVQQYAPPPQQQYPPQYAQPVPYQQPQPVPYQQPQAQFQQPAFQRPTPQPFQQQYTQNQQFDKVYHIYKSGMFSKDAKILDSNKNQVFHVEFPFAFFGAWSVTVHHGATKQGPIAMSINKPAFSWDFDIVDCGSNFRTILRKAGIFSRKHAFNGPDGKEYAWKGNGFGGDLKLIAYPEKVQVGYYDRAAFSFKKEGKIIITQRVHHMTNLIIATGFAVEEWEREQRQKQRSHRHHYT